MLERHPPVALDLVDLDSLANGAVPTLDLAVRKRMAMGGLHFSNLALGQVDLDGLGLLLRDHCVRRLVEVVALLLRVLLAVLPSVVDQLLDGLVVGLLPRIDDILANLTDSNLAGYHLLNLLGHPLWNISAHALSISTTTLLTLGVAR